ncbi:unnamed protein product [Peronospora farinosa]|uniref:Uncharacterized protein n=1 Tax=Peronospora farinosa TaxID=134698 RepID=A0AAV0T841_9STRA|nr:unnamed protein product [Peronospora farinosa]
MGPTPHGSKVLLVLQREASRKFSDNLIALITSLRSCRRYDESGIESVVKELSASHSCSKEKVEKREVWIEVEDVYSVSKPQEKDEDMMMTSQIRSLLQQFHLVLTVQDALLLAHARYAPLGRPHDK